MKKTFNNPDGLEREYTRASVKYVKTLEAIINKSLIPRIGDIVAQFEAVTRIDAWDDTLNEEMTGLGASFEAASSAIIATLPGRYELISKFNEGQFKLVVKANTGYELPPVMQGAPKSLLGVSPFRSEPFLQPLMDGWITENTRLIKSIPTALNSDLDGIIRRGVMQGKSVRDITKDIKARYPVTESRARLIAQDQTLKAHADLARYRLQSVGVKRYIWRTVGDSRVRPEHADRNGSIFSWDKPPSGGHPGQNYRCRCRAEAIFDDD